MYYRRWRGRGGHLDDIRPRNPLVQSEASPPPPLGELIDVINQSDLKNTSGENVRFGITESQLVASYNWADQKSPKIIVPGRPPLWRPLEKPRQLLEDNGVYFRDNNSAFFPNHPLEPAIISVMKMHPSPLHIDIVGCNSTVGNLFRFAQDFDKPFRMLVEVVGKTVHFIRRENSPAEQILGVRGFGHAFPEAYTIWTPEVRPSKSHHRIIKYQFGGLGIMLRQSSDGYIEEKETNDKSAVKVPAINGKDLISHLDSLSIGISPTSPSDSGILEVVDGGKPTPQESIFDVKTRSIKVIQHNTLEEEIPHLWLAQIPNFILAHHTRGTFNNIKVTDVRDDIQAWEESHQQDLSRLSSLLHRIIAIALEKQDTPLEIVRPQGGALEIRRRLPDAGVAFSDHVKDQWLEWLGKAGEVEEVNGSGERSGSCSSNDDSDGGELTAENEESGKCSP